LKKNDVRYTLSITDVKGVSWVNVMSLMIEGKVVYFGMNSSEGENFERDQSIVEMKFKCGIGSSAEAFTRKPRRH
jgi:hypothetical protein